MAGNNSGDNQLKRGAIGGIALVFLVIAAAAPLGAPYLGSLTCDFRYDPVQQSFTLSSECALQVDVPVDPSAVAALRG